MRPDTPVVAAARLLAGQDLPGLIVIDDYGRPATIVPSTQVPRLAVPRYCQDDPALARVLVAVTDPGGALRGAITLDALLDRVLAQ
ncbi:MAG: hypothetical protein ACRDTJ_07010 [Pseudonocardiaceae bacterium]